MQRERLKLLASVGISIGKNPLKPLTSAEEHKRQERFKLREILGEASVDLERLRASMFNGAIDSAGIRFLCWNLCLALLPQRKQVWDDSRQQRSERYNMIRAASANVRRGRNATTSGTLKYSCQSRSTEAAFRSEHFSVAAALVQDLEIYHTACGDGSKYEADRRRAIQRCCHEHGVTEAEALAMSISLIKMEFDLQALAYVFASALEVECVGGPGTFWCLANFLEKNLRAGGTYTLAHNLGELLAAMDSQLSEHLNSLGIRTWDFAIAWFRSLFASCLPIEILIHVWDRLLSVGLQYSVFVGAAILTLSRDKLLALRSRGATLEQLMSCRDAHVPQLLDTSLSLWTRDALVRCREDWARLSPPWEFRRQREGMVAAAWRLLQQAEAHHPFAPHASQTNLHFARWDASHDTPPAARAAIYAVQAVFLHVHPAALVASVFPPVAYNAAGGGWDPGVEGMEVVRRIDRGTCLVRLRVKCPATLRNGFQGDVRELLFLTAHVPLTNGRAMLVSQTLTPAAAGLAGHAGGSGLSSAAGILSAAGSTAGGGGVSAGGGGGGAVSGEGGRGGVRSEGVLTAWLFAPVPAAVAVTAYSASRPDDSDWEGAAPAHLDGGNILAASSGAVPLLPCYPLPPPYGSARSTSGGAPARNSPAAGVGASVGAHRGGRVQWVPPHPRPPRQRRGPPAALMGEDEAEEAAGSVPEVLAGGGAGAVAGAWAVGPWEGTKGRVVSAEVRGVAVGEGRAGGRQVEDWLLPQMAAWSRLAAPASRSPAGPAP